MAAREGVRHTRGHRGTRVDIATAPGTRGHTCGHTTTVPGTHVDTQPWQLAHTWTQPRCLAHMGAAVDTQPRCLAHTGWPWTQPWHLDTRAQERTQPRHLAHTGAAVGTATGPGARRHTCVAGQPGWLTSLSPTHWEETRRFVGQNPPQLQQPSGPQSREGEAERRRRTRAARAAREKLWQ